VNHKGCSSRVMERDRLMGRGIGDGEAHLLASARLSHSRLWSQDRRLPLLMLPWGQITSA